jgi:hypothetical protein
MPDCVFSLSPASTGPINKKGHQVQFKMIPENKICSISCSSSGDIKIVQCGGDGSVTAEATTDNAKGIVFVTKTCTRAVPDAGIVACGPTTVPINIGRRRPVPKLLIITTTSGGLGAAGFGVGFAVGGPIGGIVGFIVGLAIAFVFIYSIDP